MPQVLYEISHLQARPIEEEFYNYELVKETLSPQNGFQINNILRTRNTGGIKQHLVKWKG